MTENISISFHPVQEQLKEIGHWLEDEFKKKREGFFCNWSVIVSSYNKGNFASISVADKTIGFVIWYFSSELTAVISIIAIHPKYRKKGYGKKLIFALFEYFIAKDVCAVSLQCSPPTSEVVWRKLGFVDFPKHEYKWMGPEKELYKILLPHAKIADSNSQGEYLELWDEEIYRCQNIDAAWRWNVEYVENTNTLLYPIIHPCGSDWRIRWMQNEKPVKNTKVKYFFDNEDFPFGDFIVIRELY